MISIENLQKHIAAGEDSTRQFKVDICNAASLASEMAAFANTNGGTIFIGVIWLKAGADKRRVNSKEELRSLFQFTNQFHADELPTKAGIDKLDKLRFRDFLRDVYKQEYPDSPAELTRLL